MNKEKILDLIKEILTLYEKDPQAAVRSFGDNYNPFILIKSEKLIETDEPLFDLVLSTESLLSGGIDLDWVKDKYEKYILSLRR